MGRRWRSSGALRHAAIVWVRMLAGQRELRRKAQQRVAATCLQKRTSSWLLR